MKNYALLFPVALSLAVAGCAAKAPGAVMSSQPGQTQTLAQARQGFKTQLVAAAADRTPADVPPADLFRLVKYPAPSGPTFAYLSNDLKDGKKHPAIIWITGGDNNSIGDVWSPNAPDNDQSAAQFERVGIAMMYPAQRGGNDNPGRKEGFLGEADDILAARDFLAKQPNVDAQRIYLGGHSTGGTMALLVAEQTDKFRAIFALGAVDDVAGYGADSGFLPFDVNNAREVELRSPIHWLAGVQSPTYLIEGASGQGNIESLRALQAANSNPKIQFFGVQGGDHFSIIAPVNTVLAQKIVADNGPQSNIKITEAELNQALKSAR